MFNSVFSISNNHLVQTGTYISVPEDEPVFILRARDKQALSTIRVYQSTMNPKSKEWKIVQEIMENFTKFKQENPAKMGTPSEIY